MNKITWQSVQVRLGDLQPWQRNPRQIRREQAERLHDSFETFGQVETIAIGPKNEIYNGHQRLAVLLERHGSDYEIDARRSSRSLTEKEREKLTIYLHKGATGEWDFDILANEFDIDELLDWGFELFELGLDPPDEESAGEDTEPDFNRAEELRQKWGVETGQLWQLGEHRIICGDCTDAAVVERVMGRDEASLVFTDPPYGVAIGAKNRLLNSVHSSGRNLTDIVDDDLSADELEKVLLPAFENIRTVVMADDCTVFVTAPQRGELGMMMMMMMRKAKLPVRHVLIWKKNQPTFSLGRLDYDYQHEPILLTWGKRHKRPMLGKHRTSVWEIDRPCSSKEHPTMKPVELVENALLNNSDRADVVYDAYSGSGTTIIACENLGRQCRAVEIDPDYVAVAIDRCERHGIGPIELIHETD